MARQEAFRTDLSISDIRRLAWNASNGDWAAEAELRSQVKKLAPIANRRLRSLEKAQLDMFAYDRAITYLNNQNKRRFSTVLDTTNYRSMTTQLQELTTFINAKTSTVSKAREYFTAKITRLSEATGTHYTDEQAYYLGRLISTDSVSTLMREVRGDSSDVIEVLEDLSLQDINQDEIMSIIDKHLAGYDPWGNNSDYLNYDAMMSELRNLTSRNNTLL